MIYFKPVITKRLNKHSFIMDTIPAKQTDKGSFYSILGKK